MGLCSSTESYNVSENKEGMSADEASEFRRKVARKGRRVSVSGESGETGDDGFVPPKIPKTDKQRERIEAVILKVFLFQGLSTDELDTLIGAMSEKKIEKNEKLIKQGDVGDYFYVVDEGAFDVFVAGQNDNKPVFNYVKGGSFGELAVSNFDT